jgi:osmotically-inducible protein OsmY
MNMPRTLAFVAAIALWVYATSALSQAASPQGAAPQGAQPQATAPPAGQPAQGAAATSDEALAKAIYSALEADPNHFFRHVTVRVDNGVATLGGFVNSSSAIHRARTIAGNVPGVTRVVSGNLTLQPNRPR